MRRKQRADYERSTIHAISGQALYGHLGFVVAGRRCAIPTVHALQPDPRLRSAAPAPVLPARGAPDPSCSQG